MAVQTGLCRLWLEIPNTGFFHEAAHVKSFCLNFWGVSDVTNYRNFVDIWVVLKLKVNGEYVSPVCRTE